MSKKNKFFKNPHEIVQELGKLPITATLNFPKNLSKTCVSMDGVAKAENRDDIVRRSGTNDYSMSLERLFNAFDTFVREYSRRKSTAGQTNNYDFTDPCELTIFLLWQIRHTWTHQGGLIDEICKGEYEKALNSALIKGIKPIIDLPENLEVGSEFTIQFDAYLSVKKCIFKYIGERISEEDLKILSKRSSVTNIKFSKCDIIMTYEFGTVQIDLAEAYECGCDIDPVTQEFGATSEMFYNPETGLITVPSTGKSFPAKLIKR
ncbi:MAG: hypothetical protein OIN86_00765 [Candidatus Methanoperedens sp.]|nr:hypothetical protein [Candidatus Methanoperedens sp.]CAG0965682.1 hypothetical protein METP1_00959 [Methanosarcinales archaeon]